MTEVRRNRESWTMSAFTRPLEESERFALRLGRLPISRALQKSSWPVPRSCTPRHCGMSRRSTIGYLSRTASFARRKAWKTAFLRG